MTDGNCDLMAHLSETSRKTVQFYSRFADMVLLIVSEEPFVCELLTARPWILNITPTTFASCSKSAGAAEPHYSI